mmetsp:Transcript_40969/g.126493  ORF Transcript_40969/g.126493 Transcript_40969/m.126493 type:complete len:253 (+) Transcript_40969:57-815(+)
MRWRPFAGGEDGLAPARLRSAKHARLQAPVTRLPRWPARRGGRPQLAQPHEAFVVHRVRQVECCAAVPTAGAVWDVVLRRRRCAGSRRERLVPSQHRGCGVRDRDGDADNEAGEGALEKVACLVFARHLRAQPPPRCPSAHDALDLPRSVVAAFAKNTRAHRVVAPPRSLHAPRAREGDGAQLPLQHSHGGVLDGERVGGGLLPDARVLAKPVPLLQIMHRPARAHTWEGPQLQHARARVGDSGSALRRDEA